MIRNGLGWRLFITWSTDVLFLSSGIGKHFRFGSQEDAHEFLRYTVDAMQKSCLPGNKWVHIMQFCLLVNKHCIAWNEHFLIRHSNNCNNYVIASSLILLYFYLVRLDRQTQATTFVHQIFGGYLRSRGRSFIYFDLVLMYLFYLIHFWKNVIFVIVCPRFLISVGISW